MSQDGQQTNGLSYLSQSFQQFSGSGTLVAFNRRLLFGAPSGTAVKVH
jgi:hypothetical protein